MTDWLIDWLIGCLKEPLGAEWVCNSCVVDPCLSKSCPYGKHCVALDENNTTCAWNCPYSNCSEVVDPDFNPCYESNPCQNEGLCYKGPRGDSKCKCLLNYAGRFCESPINMCLKYRWALSIIIIIRLFSASLPQTQWRIQEFEKGAMQFGLVLFSFIISDIC